MTVPEQEIGIVVIGRNEGERLIRCLMSVCELRFPIVYVDSGSDDGSMDYAKELGVQAIPASPPFTAARARNAGFIALVKTHPQIRFIQFLDGDCTLQSDWPTSAVKAFHEEARRGIVLGHLVERSPGTAYDRLCELEWKCPPGDLSKGLIGGVFAIRAEVFEALGGFRGHMIAGEDSELGVRVKLAGHVIHKVDAAMAAHEADIRTFRQWWQRAVRAGHAIGQRHAENGASPAKDGVKELRSTLFWACVMPFAVLAAVPITHGLSLIFLAAYGILVLRVQAARRRIGDSLRDALLYAIFVVIAKFANAIGLAKFAWARRYGEFAIIEYK